MRILSLAPSNTEILYALGAGNEVVGVTAFCDFPREARSKPKVGGWTEVYSDLAERFQPDLIVTSMFVPPQVRPLQEQQPGLFCHLEPRTLEDVYANITTLGERIGRTVEAVAIVRRMRSEFEALWQATVTRRSTPLRVYIEEWSSPPMASGNWVPEIAAIAGGAQAIVHAGERSREFQFEELRAHDPDLIVLSICGAHDRVPTQQVASRLGWGELRAVRDDRIAVIDDSLLNRPGPRLAEGARALAALFDRVAQPV